MQPQLFYKGSPITEKDVPSIASEQGLPFEIVSEIVSKLKINGDFEKEDYPEEFRERIEIMMDSISNESEADHDEVVEHAAFALMGAMSDNNSFIITPDGVCTINPESPPDLVYSYQVVSSVLKLTKIGKEVDSKSSWLLGSIICALEDYFGEDFNVGQVTDLTQKSLNSIYKAQKVHKEFPPGKRYKVSHTHHSEALFLKIPKESMHLILKKTETFGLSNKYVRSFGSIVRKMGDDQVIKNIRSKEQADHLIETFEKNKIRYYVVDGDGCKEVLCEESSIPTGRIVIDTKNKVWRKDNGAPMDIQVPRKSWFMSKEKEERISLKNVDPEKFERLLDFFRKMKDLTADLQQEIAITLVQDEKFRERLERDSRRSEEWMMGQIDMGLRIFTGIIPLALRNNVNPFMSVLTMHTGITGDPLIQALIDELNAEALGE